MRPDSKHFDYKKTAVTKVHVGDRQSAKRVLKIAPPDRATKLTLSSPALIPAYTKSSTGITTSRMTELLLQNIFLSRRGRLLVMTETIDLPANLLVSDMRIYHKNRTENCQK
ncbi:MAG: Uncharacterised protein [Hyphomonas sp. TMED17]|nr:MAG: Uncharacterised protein [Hyphomonas sp. TMED17]